MGRGTYGPQLSNDFVIVKRCVCEVTPQANSPSPEFALEIAPLIHSGLIPCVSAQSGLIDTELAVSHIYRALVHPIARLNFVRAIAVERFAVLEFHRSLANISEIRPGLTLLRS